MTAPAGPRGDCDVLVVGAGPTGLVLALWLARSGVRVRIVDKAPNAGTQSRAVGVAARTLELYATLGLADEVIAAGWKTPAFNLWARGEHVAHVPLGELGEGLSPYPYELMYPQGAHERLLGRHLAAAGVTIERPRSVVAIDQDDDGVRARLDNGVVVRAAYVAGCDGAHSTIRERLGIALPGGTYEHVFFVCDLDATGPLMNGELHVSLDRADFLAAFPLAVGRARIVGTVRGRKVGAWADVERDVTERLRLSGPRVRDFSTYHVHHRVAAAFRKGRVLLCGDAAHLHSPVGAQGMNTGIGDAINAGWKLAAVLGGAPESLLDSYEPERIAFARRLVATTDRVFRLVDRDGGLASLARTRLAPLAVRTALALPAARRTAFRMLSQLVIDYRDSPISTGRAGSVHAGDRLPWVRELDNFRQLAERRWQVHVYGDAPQLLDAVPAAVPLHVFPWTDAVEAAGLQRGAAYVVRPDGYVGCASSSAGPDELAAYLARVT